MSALATFGDSITVGSPYSAPWTPAVASALSRTLVNRAVNGDQAADQAFAAYGFVPNATDLCTFLLGTNDQRTYGGNATKKVEYERFLRSVILSAAAPSRVTAMSGSMSFPAGTWTPTAVNTIGKYVDGIGGKASATVSGTAVYIQCILQDSAGAQVNLKVTIDSVVQPTQSIGGLGMTTVNSRTYAPGVLRFGGLSSGSHLVELEVIAPLVGTSPNRFYLDYIAGSSQAVKPAGYVLTIPRMTAAGYAATGIGSDAIVADYNAIIAGIVSGLAADGLNVSLVDLWAAIDPATDLDSGGVHFITSGATKAANAVLAVISGGPPVYTFDPAVGVYPRKAGGVRDGTYWIIDGAIQKQIVTL